MSAALTWLHYWTPTSGWADFPVPYCVKNNRLKHWTLYNWCIKWGPPNTVSVSRNWPTNFHSVRFVIFSRLDSCSVACGGIPGSSSRHSLPPAYFMGTGGRASQMVFLRNYYVLIHCEGAGCSHPPLPSYWEVTVRLTVQRECMKNREEGGLMGEVERCYLSTFAVNVRHCV